MDKIARNKKITVSLWPDSWFSLLLSIAATPNINSLERHIETLPCPVSPQHPDGTKLKVYSKPCNFEAAVDEIGRQTGLIRTVKAALKIKEEK